MFGLMLDEKLTQNLEIEEEENYYIKRIPILAKYVNIQGMVVLFERITKIR